MNYIQEYYDTIESGQRNAGRFEKLLAKYLVDGLNDGLFWYDEQEAEDDIEWIETHCFHTEGALAPNNIELELWEKWIVSSMFAIKENGKNKRQFRETLLVVARKNGKSLIATCIAKLVFEKLGGYGAKLYCTAPKLDQADIIYDNVWLMTQLDPEWQEEEQKIRDSIVGHNRKEYDDSNHTKKRVKDIYKPSTNTSMKKVAFNDRKNDGFNPSLIICDEISSWVGEKGLKNYEVWKSACGAREMGDNPSIILSCTTSGYINDSIYDELIKRSTRFLMGESNETKLLPFIFMIDDVDNWKDIKELEKSNPNLDVSVTSDYLKEEIAIAEGSSSKKAEFLTKYCNIKQNSSLAWLSSEDIKKACGEPLSLDKFRSHYCVAGIDLSQTTDLTCACIVVQEVEELYIIAKFFLPFEKIDEAKERDGLPYQRYIEEGWLMPSGENFVDYRDCFNWLVEMVEEYELLPLMVGYDRYSAQYLIQDLNNYGFRTDDVYQGENLYGVLKEFEGLLKDGKIHIGNNDLLKVHFLNSAIKMSVERGRGKLIKLNPSDHIDGMAAVADAFCVRQKWWDTLGAQLRNE